MQPRLRHGSPSRLPRSDREPQADSSSGTSSRVVALAVGAAGVGALVAGVVLALDYRSKNDEATDICPSAVNCSRAEVERHGQLVDDARSSRNWSYLAFGVGGAAVLGGGDDLPHVGAKPLFAQGSNRREPAGRRPQARSVPWSAATGRRARRLQKTRAEFATPSHTGRAFSRSPIISASNVD